MIIAKNTAHLPICKKYIRRYCETRYHPVMLIRGNSPPILCGSSYHYETNGGRRIFHPSAYSKKGWSNMNYIPSSLRIEVGENWNILKTFPRIKNSVDYLSYMLEDCNYYVSFIDGVYNIYSEDLSKSYRGLSLSQFRSIAKRIINLIAFS